MIKRILYFVIIYISVSNLFAQDPSKFIAVDSNGNTYEIDPSNCSYNQKEQCNLSQPLSLALINNYVYYTDWLSLFRFQYNTSGACEFLGIFDYSGLSLLSGLTSGPDGLIYAAAGNTILRYNPITNVFSNLGNIPSQWQCSGDLVFFNGELLLSTINDKLVQIDLNNLSNSHVILSFPSNTDIFGLSTVSPPCGSYQLFAINASQGQTSLLPINLTTNTVGTPICNLPFVIYDTASLSENGSSSNVPIFTQVASICLGTTLTALPTTSNNGITGTWSPAINNTTTTTYTFTPNTGQCASATTMTITVDPNGTPIFTQVPAICSGATLTALPTTSNNGVTGTWSPALNNTNTTIYTFTPTVGQCKTTMTITVNPNTTPTFTQVASICSGATLSALPTTSNNGVTGTWSPGLVNTATTTYTFTPNTGQCANITTMTITVDPNQLPIFTQVPAICSGATLTALPTTSNNGITGIWSPALNNINTTTYTFTPTVGQCITTMTISVNPIIPPAFTQVPAICTGATLTALPTTSNNGYIGTWSPALNNTTTTTYTFTPTVGQCATTATMTISVDPIPGNPDSMQHPEICSEDFTNINITTTPQIPGTILKWEVIDSSNNVTGFTQSGSGLTSISIYDNLFNNSEDQGFVIYRVTSFLGDCKGLYTDITVVVNPLPKPDLKNGTICVNETSGIYYTNYTLDSQLLNPDFTYQWFILNTITDTYEALANANESTYEVNQEGTYKVVVTNETTTCKQSDIATVISAYPAQEISATVTNNFTNNTIITVTTNPTGILNLIYSLDNSEWQDSNIFTGVEPGLHTITVTDLQDCTNLSIEVFVFDYPKFFTPNGDDINDTWNIIGLNQPEAKLFIFDRYGKLIKQLSTTSKGWDGNYNGAKLPSGDYWFKLDYTENGIPKQFKSHFSLKR